MCLCLRTYRRVKIGINHSNDPYVTIKAWSKVPFMQSMKIGLRRVTVTCKLFHIPFPNIRNPFHIENIWSDPEKLNHLARMSMDSRIFQKLQEFPTSQRQPGSMKISSEPSRSLSHCTCWRYPELRKPLRWRECASGRCNRACSHCWEQYSKMLQRSSASTSSVKRNQDFRCGEIKVQKDESLSMKCELYITCAKRATEKSFLM